MTSAETPVLLVVFNRPGHVAQVLSALRAARPPLLLVAADGPRLDHPDDVELCSATRAVIDNVDWSCEVLWDTSELNLGVDRRVPSGIDWALSLVDRVIILEDDVMPSPSFFPWCAAMLDRYQAADDVVHVSGRNDLGVWGPPGLDHLIVRRGSIWGWATWARAWQRIDRDLPTAGDPAELEKLEARGFDPLLGQHLAIHLEAAVTGSLRAWDCRWSAARALDGGWAVVPPVNLVSNIGFGPDAARTKFADDPRAGLTAGEAPPLNPFGSSPSPDAQYDRRTLLAELMATYREPEMVLKLARSRRLLVGPDGQPDTEALHHLAPVDYAAESLAVLEHLRNYGLVSAQFDRVAKALELAIGNTVRR